VISGRPDTGRRCGLTRRNGRKTDISTVFYEKAVKQVHITK
jgi:hypothetical protein